MPGESCSLVLILWGQNAVETNSSLLGRDAEDPHAICGLPDPS